MDNNKIAEFLNDRDRFARLNGIQITATSDNFAVAEMTVEERHLNGGDVCQGGAIFTLADLANAMVMNASGQLTVGINNNISFVSSARLGDHLTANATLVADHKKMPMCEVRVYNQDKRLIAVMTGQGYRKAASVG
ncbi:MAG: PaaI family thioesterase [Prevotella sp.]|nr:PaaI family thioesterase [Prevotella sp.]